mmetsp:Transcript_86894/g.202290  ORF Transcript_86894/g.202290 Transcript_86894/m.202290 type:complete len:94 (+) Transcript_86894:2-283(+)
MKNKKGKVVTVKMHAQGKQNYGRISGWTEACQQAKKALGIVGFSPVGGKSLQGKALYVKAKSIYATMCAAGNSRSAPVEPSEPSEPLAPSAER